MGKLPPEDKYEKVRRQEEKFYLRIGSYAALGLVAFIVIHFLLHPHEDQALLQQVEHDVGEAANKWLHGGSSVGGGNGGGENLIRSVTKKAGEVPVVTKTDEVPKAKAAPKVAQSNAADNKATEEALVQEVERLDAEVRQIKASLPQGHFMETDPKGVDASKRLQEATRKLLGARYGVKEPYRVRLDLEFQPTIPDFEKDGGKDGHILIEMAPSELQPHSIFTYLEVARNYGGGGFHRIAGHVLQVQVRAPGVKHLAFQEYSPDYPHKKGTVGYAGRPSGPAWYVSLVNNVRNHGPGSQQKANPHEADSCFGTVIEGFDTDVQRIRKVDGDGFLGDHKKWVLIKKMQIMVPGDDGEYIEWEPKA